MATLLGDARIRLRPDTSGFGGEAKSGIDRAMGAVGTAIKRSFQAAGVAAGGLFATAVKKGWDRLTAIEDAEAKLKGLGNSAADVSAIMADALASVKGTAYGLGDAATVAASTVAAGVKPGKDLERTLKLVADAATIGGSSMNEMGSIFNKVATSNKAQADVLNQLADRGIPIFQLLADELGVTGEEVSKLASEGKIDFETFQAAMEAGLGGAALKSAETTRGAIANFGAALSRMGAGFLDGVFPQIRGLFVGAIEWADKATPFMEDFGAKAGAALAGVVEKAPEIWDKIKGVMKDLAPVWASLRGTAGNFLQIAKDLGPILGVAFGGALAVVVGLLEKAAPLLEAVTGWMAENTDIVAIAVGVWGGYKVATELAAGAQVLLNRAMSANPIGLVVTALALLAGAAVWAWKNSETFRNIVTGVWDAVQKAAKFAWERVLKPTFEFLAKAWDAVASGIAWAWEKFIKPTWDVIASVLKTLWENVAKPIFGLIGAAWDALALVFKIAWEGVIEPVFAVLWSTVSFLWNEVLSPIFTLIGNAWSGMATGFKWVWDNVLDPVFSVFKSVVEGLTGVFNTVVDGIKGAWNAVKAAIGKPIYWVIDTVWNKGILAAWDWIGEKLWDKPKSTPFPKPDWDASYATGGVLPGYTPGRDVHKFVSPTGGILNLSGGEAVMRPEVTRALGVEGVNALNAAARGGGTEAVRQQLQGMFDHHAAEMSFADGGVIPFPGWLRAVAPDWMESWVDKVNNNEHVNRVADMLKSTTSTAWAKLREWLAKIGRDTVRGASVYDLDGDLAGYSGDGTGAAHGFFSGGGGRLGSNYIALGNFVRRTFPGARITSSLRNTPDLHGAGKAVDIAGPYPAPFGSKFMADIAAHLYSNYKPQIAELIYNGIGKRTSNIKNSADLAYNRATQLQHRNHVHLGVYDQGGVLNPGLTLTANKTGRPEAVLTPEQWDVVARIAEGGAAPVVGGNLVLQAAPGSSVRDQMEEAMFQLRRFDRGGGRR